MVEIGGVKEIQTIDGPIDQEVIGMFAPYIIKLSGNKLALKESGNIKIFANCVNPTTGEIYKAKTPEYNEDIENIPNDEILHNCTFLDLKISIGMLAERIARGLYKPVVIEEPINNDETVTSGSDDPTFDPLLD